MSSSSSSSRSSKEDEEVDTVSFDGEALRSSPAPINDDQPILKPDSDDNGEEEKAASHPLISKTVIVLVGFFGGNIFGYQTGIISTCLDYLVGEYAILDGGLKGFVTSAILFGALAGSLVAGFIANKVGRRWAIVIAAAISLLGTSVQCFSFALWFFVILRIILGFSVGLVGVVCPMFVSEASPAHLRGRLGVVFQLSICFGILVAGIVGFLFSISTMEDTFKWRLQLGVGVIFPIGLLVLALWKVTESPTFLKIKAKQTAKKGTDALDEDEAEQAAEGSCRAFFCRKSSIKYIAIAAVLSAALQLTGVNAIFYYGPQIIAAAGFDNKYLLNIALGGWNFVATFAAVFLIDKWGRRPLILLGLGVNTASLLLVAISFLVLNGIGLAAGVGTGLLVYIAGFEFGIGCLFWVIVNELFPTNIRSPAAVFSNVLTWSFNIALALSFPTLTASAGSAGTFFIFTAIALASVIFMAIFLKETKAK